MLNFVAFVNFFKGNLQKLWNWEKVCGVETSCKFITDGFGRWVGGVWKPFNDSKYFIYLFIIINIFKG